MGGYFSLQPLFPSLARRQYPLMEESGPILMGIGTVSLPMNCLWKQRKGEIRSHGNVLVSRNCLLQDLTFWFLTLPYAKTKRHMLPRNCCRWNPIVVMHSCSSETIRAFESPFRVILARFLAWEVVEYSLLSKCVSQHLPSVLWGKHTLSRRVNKCREVISPSPLSETGSGKWAIVK